MKLLKLKEQTAVIEFSDFEINSIASIFRIANQTLNDNDFSERIKFVKNEFMLMREKFEDIEDLDDNSGNRNFKHNFEPKTIKLELSIYSLKGIQSVCNEMLYGISAAKNVFCSTQKDILFSILSDLREKILPLVPKEALNALISKHQQKIIKNLRLMPRQLKLANRELSYSKKISISGKNHTLNFSIRPSCKNKNFCFSEINIIDLEEGMNNYQSKPFMMRIRTLTRIIAYLAVLLSDEMNIIRNNNNELIIQENEKTSFSVTLSSVVNSPEIKLYSFSVFEKDENVITGGFNDTFESLDLLRLRYELEEFLALLPRCEA